MRPSTAIVLFAHGARDPEWAEPFIKIRDLVAAQFPATPVHVAYLELMHPSLSVLIAELAQQGVQHLTLIPLFMARGGHLKQDLPRLLGEIYQQHPQIRFHLSPAIGEVEPILQGISAWVGEQHRAAQTTEAQR
jgi:sirohydrochlorin cobaltochelatase